MAQKSTSKKLLGNSLLYTISGLLSKCLNFFLLPIYTRILTTSDYGIQNLIFSFNSVMCYVILLCIDSAAIKFYSDYKDDKQKLKHFYGTGVSLISVTSGLTIICCYIFRDILTRSVFDGVDFFPYVVIGLGILLLEAFYTFHRRILEAQQNGKKVTIVSVCMVFFTALLTLILVGVLKKGAVGLLLSSLVVYLGAIIFVAVDAVRYDMVQLCFDRNLAIRMLKYSIPLLPHQTSAYLANFISRILLNFSGSLAVVGLFSVASQFSSVIPSKNRNMIRKAIKNGVKIYNGRYPEIFEIFREIYNGTMDKDNADAYYYFEPEFYNSVLNDLSDNAEIFYAVKDGVVIAASIMIFANGMMNYHLSGSLREYSSLAATNLLLYKTALWGCANGYKTLYLGGGVGSGEDSLFKFKRAFYRGELNHFYIGKKIYNKEKYNELLNIRIRENPDISNSGFFPKYRGD